MEYEHQLLDIVKNSMETREICSGIFMDFAQAFDKVWSINWNEVPYFKSILSNIKVVYTRLMN